MAAILLACAGAHVLATRLSWSGIPLQTDAGMWAYIGGRILDGAVLYKDLWESKPPGIYYLFAGIQWLFGRGQDAAFLWLDAALSLSVLAVTYVVARRFASRTAAAAAVLLLSIVFCHRILADWGNNVEKFVALFEMLACLLFLGAIDQDRPGRRLISSWLAMGVCCGLAELFKQTGVLFFLTAVIAASHAGLRRRQSLQRWPAKVGLLVAGTCVVWGPILVWMLASGNLRPFCNQVVTYDLARVSSSSLERFRLADGAHWRSVAETLKLAAILFAPAAIAFLFRLASRSSGGQTPSSRNSAPSQAALGVVLLYWLLTTAVFAVAPYGYGHYILQAAPAAAVLAAWLLDRIVRRDAGKVWAGLACLAVLLGAMPLKDHFLFTFDSAYQFRLAYNQLAERTQTVADIARAKSAPGQAAMLWPTDYAVSYYAQRRTPLECSNSDVIFKGKLFRLSPPMPELLERLKADPPDVIVDWTPLDFRQADEAAGRLELGVPAAGFSLAEEPNENHAFAEGRALAAMKRWVREQYGGQERIGICTVYYRGKPWRPWEEVLMQGDSQQPPGR